MLNEFLSWDNNDKNKAIFDISSYALEYCMLTNKNGNTSLHLTNLKNKNFYLDTNIIYRVLGINGENRKKRSNTFLKKFKESGENLFISKSTEYEFKEGIKGHADKINQYRSPKTKSILFQEFTVQKDIYNFYHNWRIGKSNTSIDLFIAEIFSLYDRFKSDFKITLDVDIPYKIDDKNSDDILKNYSSSIASFKMQEGNGIIGSSSIDAENIYWIEKKRNNKTQNIFETKYFFISTDQGLRRWDYQRSNKTPIVLLPSQWMSVILRYFNCTNDDYKSFVSFLNLRNTEKLINGEKLHIVLSGISEMTESILQQRTILKNLVENKFNGVITRRTTSNQIFKNAKKYAKSELEKQVERLNVKNEELTENQVDIVNKSETMLSEIGEIKKQSSETAKELSKKNEENKELKNLLIKKETNDEFAKWKRPAYFYFFITFIIISFVILQFSFKKWGFNYPYKITQWIDLMKKGVGKSTLTTLMYAPLLALWKIIPFVWHRFVSSEKRRKKKEEIHKRIKEKYSEY